MLSKNHISIYEDVSFNQKANISMLVIFICRRNWYNNISPISPPVDFEGASSIRTCA